MDKPERPEASLGVDHSMLYNMQTYPEESDGGTSGEVGERTANPRNMNVLTSMARSARPLSNTCTKKEQD